MNVIPFSIAVWTLGGLGMYVSSRKVDAARRRARWIKFGVYFAVMNGVLWAASLGPWVFAALVSILAAIGAFELFHVRASLVAWPVFAAAALGSIAFAVSASPGEATFVYLMVALFDGFSQIFGQLLGRTPLSPRISPSKTVEGAIGGAVVTISSAAFLQDMIALAWPLSAIAALAIIPASLAGDLAASWVKRRAGAKDYGNLLPGHGGILDRFDSFFFAAPVWWVLFGRTV